MIIELNIPPEDEMTILKLAVKKGLTLEELFQLAIRTYEYIDNNSDKGYKMTFSNKEGKRFS